MPNIVIRINNKSSKLDQRKIRKYKNRVVIMKKIPHLHIHRDQLLKNMSNNEENATLNYHKGKINLLKKRTITVLLVIR